MESLDQQLTAFVKLPIGKMVLLGLLVWSSLVGYSLNWNITNLQNEKINLAISAAKSNWNKDQAFRQWATKHGGVYVPVTERTPPNPYLAHLKRRDVETTGGMKLTLMNPAYMLRQLTNEFEDSYGIKGKITGKITLNPVNKADAWERAALDRFERESISEIYEQTEIDGAPYMRYMKPMYMIKACEQCHAVLGFRDGDLRGGVSVSIPMQPYLDAEKETTRSMMVTHAVVWLAGSIGFMTFGLYAHRRHIERSALLARLEHGALYDSLTGLPNRSLFSDRLQVSMAKRKRDRTHLFAVCFVDLDRFKNLNDSYGHAVGDQLLKEVSGRFSGLLRPSDTVARMGGDEFTFLLDDLSKPQEAYLVAERILHSVETPFEIRGQSLKVGASIGICYGDRKYQSPDEILRDADTAMYRAKYLGRGRIDIFEPEMHDEVAKTTRIEHDLHTVLERQELSIHYQPIINLVTDRVDGFEALLRWQHPILGNIPPDLFIPIAESSDVIQEIGQWVLDCACRQVQKWNSQYSDLPPRFLSVNLSARQVSHLGFVQVMKDTLDRVGFDPIHLHCEVTETLLITDQDTAISNMASLRQLGIQLSADDFGKGYSSLTYLQNYSFNVLKIDKTFVQDMAPGGKGKRLVGSLLRLAKDFGLSVVAEGVETREQLETLRRLHCKWVQGYYLCPPVTADAMERLLTTDPQLLTENLLVMKPEATQKLAG
ncbi:EAL domain-containing protein [Sedimenticola sp.]|uniref:EAL domain-containing protein n=1 Tax=Sedimenticola sp. TaxID=1940285 RepID=UPI003D0C6926